MRWPRISRAASVDVLKAEESRRDGRKPAEGFAVSSPLTVQGSCRAELLLLPQGCSLCPHVCSG